MTMRRLLAALAALSLLAHDASAGRVAIIAQWGRTSNENTTAASHYIYAVTSACDALGVDYDVLAQTVVASTTTSNPAMLNQAALTSGLVYFSNGANALTKQYVAMIHMEFIPTNSGGAISINANRSGGYNPDTLTRAPGWGTIPHLFFGAPTCNGANFKETATCSTGVQGAETGYSGQGSKLSFTSPGYDEVFKVKDAVYYNNAANGVRRSATDPMQVRARVVAGASALAYNTQTNFTASWPDSMFSRAATTYSSPLSDTMMIWTRELRKIPPSMDSAMKIFALPIYTGGGGVDMPIGMVAMAIALLDSATSGQVIGQKAGWAPPVFAAVVSGAFSRSSSAPGENSLASHGVQCATRCDTTFTKAGIDSLKKLGIPLTVTLDPDSVAAFPYEKAWWAGISQARFAPDSRVGCMKNETGADVFASAVRSPDLFGYRRTRTMGTYNELAGTADCADADTGLVCQLKRTKARLDSIPEFRGRVGGFIMAAGSDYLGANWPASAAGEDTLAAALRRAGFVCAGMDLIRLGAGPQSWHNSSAGDIIPGLNNVGALGAPNMLDLRQRAVRSAFGLGDFNFLAFRGIDEDVVGSMYTNHDITNEFMNGFFCQNWYNNQFVGYPNWNHQFFSRLSLFVIRPGDLGFTNPTSMPMDNGQVAVARPGYQNIKWIVAQLRLINKFAWAGHKAVIIGYPEDVKP